MCTYVGGRERESHMKPRIWAKTHMKPGSKEAQMSAQAVYVDQSSRERERERWRKGGRARYEGWVKTSTNI